MLEILDGLVETLAGLFPSQVESDIVSTTSKDWCPGHFLVVGRGC